MSDKADMNQHEYILHLEKMLESKTGLNYRLAQRCVAYKGQVKAGSVEIERLKRENSQLHKTCEMLSADTSPKESTGDAELDEVIEDHQNAEDLKWSDNCNKETGNE